MPKPSLPPAQGTLEARIKATDLTADEVVVMGEAIQRFEDAQHDARQFEIDQHDAQGQALRARLAGKAPAPPDPRAALIARRLAAELALAGCDVQDLTHDLGERYGAARPLESIDIKGGIIKR